MSEQVRRCKNGHADAKRQICAGKRLSSCKDMPTLVQMAAKVLKRDVQVSVCTPTLALPASGLYAWSRRTYTFEKLGRVLCRLHLDGLPA